MDPLITPPRPPPKHIEAHQLNAHEADNDREEDANPPYYDEMDPPVNLEELEEGDIVARPYRPAHRDCKCQHRMKTSQVRVQSQATIPMGGTYANYAEHLVFCGVPVVRAALCPCCGSYAYPVAGQQPYNKEAFFTAIAAYHGLVHIGESRRATFTGRGDRILSLVLWLGLILHGLIASAILISAGHNRWDLHDTIYGLAISFLVTFILALFVGGLKIWAFWIGRRAQVIAVYCEDMYNRFQMLANEELRNSNRVVNPLAHPPVWCGLYEEVEKLINRETAQKCSTVMDSAMSSRFGNYIYARYANGAHLVGGHAFRHIMARLGHVQQGVTVA